MFYLSKIIKKIINIPAVKNTSIHKTSRVDIGSIISDCNIGKYSYIGDHSVVVHAKIGSFTSISNYCSIGCGEHPTDWVSTSPLFNSSESILRKNFSKNPYAPFKETSIGNDVWIGTHCMIKSGVNIGNGAVIGMGSVVTKNVGSYEIWAGNPAKLIRKRFDDQTITKLNRIQWWNWDEAKIKKSSSFMNDISFFLKEIEK